MIPRTWILGAPDPEMEAIERLLLASGERVLHAVGRDGRRVTAATAYAPHAVSGDVDEDDHAILVECDLPAERVVSVKRCDHHRPGDPGFGREPWECLSASSLGQVISILAESGALPEEWTLPAGADGDMVGIAWVDSKGEALVGVPATPKWRLTHSDPAQWAQIPPLLLLVAAADHCLGAAYRGECPGVDPDALMDWRAASRATFQRRPVAAVLADVAAAMIALREAPTLILAEGVPALRDLRRPVPVPELPEAAARLGVGYVSGPLRNRNGGPDKFTCSGTPAQVRAWMEVWAPVRLTGIYGDPERGFAGGYEGATS